MCVCVKQNAPVSFAAMEACVANPASDTVHCPTYLFLRGAYIAADSSAMYVQFKPVFDPSGLFGKSWLKAMRAAMKQQAADTGYSLYLAGAGADAADMITTYAPTLAHCVVPLRVCVVDCCMCADRCEKCVCACATISANCLLVCLCVHVCVCVLPRLAACLTRCPPWPARLLL